MTYNIGTPNSAQSPALFPVQCNVNFDRLRQNINADHLFLDTYAVNQGTHRQCSFFNRTVPVGLPSGVDGILYTFSDTFGDAQLAFYNGTNYPITPINQAPQKIMGVTSLLAPAASETIFTTNDNVSGTACVVYVADATLRYAYYKFIKEFGFVTTNLITSTGALPPSVAWAPNTIDLQAKNNSNIGFDFVIRYYIDVDIYI